MKKHIQLITSGVSLSLLSISAIGQTATVSSGGEISGSGGSASFSIGQVSYTLASGSTGVANQGIQQPFEVYNFTSTNEADRFALTYFPNPATDRLNLEFDDVYQTLQVQITDMQGKRIKDVEINALESQINIQELVKGSYLLSVFHNNLKLKTYQFIKH